jgi:type II secretory pathway pseudopilin PulG
MANLPSKSGFTFIEALITLLISSLILTSVFALARRMTTDAGQLEGRLRSVVSRSTLEAEVRQIAGAFVVMPTPALPDTVEKMVFSGNSRKIDGTISASRPIPCAANGGTFAISLTLETDAAGGDALFCARGRQKQKLAHFPSGNARFRFLNQDTGALEERWVYREPPSGVSLFTTAAVDRETPLDGLTPSIVLEWQDGQTRRAIIAPTLTSGPARPNLSEFEKPEEFQ